MQPWDISASAAAAIDWLREGAVVTDWWQMPQEEGMQARDLPSRPPFAIIVAAQTSLCISYLFTS